jgi:hypothetical protein
MSELIRFRWGVLGILAYGFVCSPLMGLVIPDVQPISLDQPRVYALLKRPGSSIPLLSGDEFAFEVFLDTGASGVLLSREFGEALNVQRQRVNGQDVIYSDVGVGGTDDFFVSEPLNISLANYEPSIEGLTLANHNTLFTQTFNDIRMQMFQTPAQPFIPPLNIFGMPVMQNKVVVMDPKPVDTFLDTMRTYIYNPGTPFNPAQANSNPGIPQTSHHVRMSYGDFERFTTVSPPTGIPPTIRDNPFIGPNPVLQLDPNPPVDDTPPVIMSLGNRSTTGSLLLDTGAVTSIISEETADDLAVRYRPGTVGTDNPQLEQYDPANPNAVGTLLPDQFILTIAGVGGQATIAGFFMDSMLLRTEEGDTQNLNDPNHMRFVRAPALVLDITVQDPVTNQQLTLDGIFGMSYLVASAFISEGPGGPVFGDLATGNFEWVVFDQTQNTLGLTPLYPNAPGDYNGDGSLTCADVNMLIAAKISGQSTGFFDLNGDDVVNQTDLNLWITDLKDTLPGDANFDRVVDGTDFGIWNSNKFTHTADWCRGDFNGDGAVDGSDYGVWNTNKFRTAPDRSLVPEPTGALWGICMAVIAKAQSSRRYSPRSGHPRSRSLSSHRHGLDRIP